MTTLKVASSLLYSLLTKYPDNEFGFFLTKKKWGKGCFIKWHHKVPVLSMRKSSQEILSQTWEREQSSPAALPYPRQVFQGFPSPLVPNYFKCVIMIFIKYTNILWITSSSRFPFPFGLKVFQFEMESLTVINQYDRFSFTLVSKKILIVSKSN